MQRPEFERLALAELDAVYRFARFLTRDVAQAEDLVQDVYTRAFRPESIDSFKPRGGGMRAWLLTIARTNFYGRLEHEKVVRNAMPRIAEDARDRHDSAEAPDAAEVSSVDWTRAGPVMHEAVASLSAELRETLWLWAVEGLKYREIGEALGVPIGTVMSRLHRARSQAARAILREEAVATELARAGVVGRHHDDALISRGRRVS